MLKVKRAISETLASPSGVTKLRGFPENSLKQINSLLWATEPTHFFSSLCSGRFFFSPHLDLEKYFKGNETTNYVVLCNITNFEAQKKIKSNI